MSEKSKIIDIFNEYDKNVKHEVILKQSDREKLNNQVIFDYLGSIKDSLKKITNIGLRQLKPTIIGNPPIYGRILDDIGRYLYEIILSMVDDEINIKNRVDPIASLNIISVVRPVIFLYQSNNAIEYISKMDEMNKYTTEDTFNFMLSDEDKPYPLPTYIDKPKAKIGYFIGITANAGAVGFGIYILTIICLIIFSVLFIILTSIGLIIIAIVICAVWITIGYVVYRTRPIHKDIKMLLICIILGPLALFL